LTNIQNYVIQKLVSDAPMGSLTPILPLIKTNKSRFTNDNVGDITN